MNITLFIGSLVGGGAERVFCNLANSLASKGHQVTIVTNVEAQGVYELEPSVNRFVLLPEKQRKNKFFNFIHCMKELKKYIKKNPSNNYVVFLPLTTIMLLAYRKIILGRVVVSERGAPDRYSSFIKLLLKKWIHRSNCVVFQTDDVKNWYQPYLKKAEGVVIPNAINPAFIREPYLGVKEKSIVAAGRLCEQKNFALLIEAFSRISDEFSDYKLKIYGKGSLETQLKELTENKGLSDRVEFMGYVDNMPEQLEKASLFVLSSDFEGMPNALMEAMALGLPCVSTECPCGGPKFLIKDKENGLLVPVNDVEAMAAAIREMLASEELRNNCGENARKVVETLNPQKIYGTWEKVIEESTK